jgi:phosphoribosylformylglycinamidine synthase PurS subunit
MMTEPTTSTRWIAQIRVTLKDAVVDPQGDTILMALHHLHFSDVERVRAGKYLEVTLTASDEADARQQIDAMCQKLLANPIIEHYDFAIAPTLI